MLIPDFQSLMLPMLQLAADGQAHRLRDAITILAAQCALTDDERTELLPSGGQARFTSKVGWARTHLGKALLLESPRRGWFQITERGRALLADPPARMTVAYLMRYPEYIVFRGKGEASAPDKAAAPAAITAEPGALINLDDAPPDAIADEAGALISLDAAPLQTITDEADALLSLDDASPETAARDGSRQDTPAPRRLSALEAAYQVLAAANEPLHSNEIARRMLDQGLWSTRGQTPGATVDAQIAVDIKANGDASRFRRVGRSIFMVNDAAPPAAPTPAPATNGRASVAQRNGLSPLSFTDAAEQVLQRFGQGQPMHYQTITRQALDLGLIATAGQTPAASMYAVILTEIDRALKRVLMD